MFKPVAAIVLSGVLAVTSLTASTAQADPGEDFARLLLGALVIYGIKEAVDDRNDRRAASTRTRPKVVTTPRKFLPQDCILEHRLHHRDVRRVFGNRCLRHSYHQYASLPDRCFRRFDTVQGMRVGWSPRCLRREGYTW